MSNVVYLHGQPAPVAQFLWIERSRRRRLGPMKLAMPMKMTQQASGH
jgi:hypothetical protein